MFAQGLEDMEVEEEQDVTFEVRVTTEKAEIHWVKQGVVIQPGDRFTLQDCGHNHTLTIQGVQASDRGRYSCESLHDRTDCRLNVLRKSQYFAGKPLIPFQLPFGLLFFVIFQPQPEVLP